MAQLHSDGENFQKTCGFIMQQILTPSVKFTVAIVDGDDVPRNSMCRYLEESGYTTWGVGSIEDFYIGLLKEKADLVIVDLDLGVEPGLGLVRRLVAQRIPVIVLSQSANSGARVASFDAGALQYFVKPLSLAELGAGIRAQLRQLEMRVSNAEQQNAWRLDLSVPRLIAPNQRTIRLTSRECELLECLMAANGGMVSKSNLVKAMGHADAEDGFHRIESSLMRLRRKTLAGTQLMLPVRAVFGKGLVFVP